MPTYEYKCCKCGHQFEKFQSMTAEPLKKCPECKGKVKRLIGTGAGIIFKGDGFYCTDYRKSSYTEAAGKDKDRGAADSAKSAGAKPEAAPAAAKSETKKDGKGDKKP